MLKSYTTSVEFKKKQGGDGGIIEIRQNEKGGGELSSKGTELTHTMQQEEICASTKCRAHTVRKKEKKSTME